MCRLGPTPYPSPSSTHKSNHLLARPIPLHYKWPSLSHNTSLPHHVIYSINSCPYTIVLPSSPTYWERRGQPWFSRRSQRTTRTFGSESSSVLLFTLQIRLRKLQESNGDSIPSHSHHSDRHFLVMIPIPWLHVLNRVTVTFSGGPVPIPKSFLSRSILCQ